MIKKIASMQDGEDGVIEATAVGHPITTRFRNRMVVTKLIVTDETDKCLITWFNQPYVKERLEAGEKYRFYGRITRKNGKPEMNSPVFDGDGENKNEHIRWIK